MASARPTRAIEALLDAVDLPNGIDGQVAGAVFMAVLGRMTEPTGAARRTATSVLRR